MKEAFVRFDDIKEMANCRDKESGQLLCLDQVLEGTVKQKQEAIGIYEAVPPEVFNILGRSQERIQCVPALDKRREQCKIHPQNEVEKGYTYAEFKKLHPDGAGKMWKEAKECVMMQKPQSAPKGSTEATNTKKPWMTTVKKRTIQLAILGRNVELASGRKNQ